MRALPEFWRRLTWQSCFSKCEIVFLDSGSTDGTVELLSSLPCTIWTIPPGEFRFGTSCNMVMSVSQAPVAVLISGHVLLTEASNLQTAFETVAGHQCAAAYCRQQPNSYLGSNAYERAYLARRFPAGDGSPVELSEPGAFSNAASVLTREAWRRNPFPDSNASEDHMWAKKHLKLGGKLFYLPHLQVLHSHNESPQAVYNRVRINVEARGLTHSYGRAAMYCGGIFGATLRQGASVKEAWHYAFHHARAYL